jgi:desulfoferrodoxin (superoxide reductase-like protein)
MARQPIFRARGLSRRDFLGIASTIAGFYASGAQAGPPKRRFLAGDAALLSPLEREHLPVLRIPAKTRNAHKVPIVVEMSHPMTREHHVTKVEVVNERDPLPSLGTFRFSPAAGAVYVGFQARIDDGDSEVTVTAECNRHGAWAIRRRITVAEDPEGCSATAPPRARTAGEDIHPPEIRIPELVERGRIRRGDIIHPQLKIRHPNRTGTAGSLHLNDLEVWFAGQRVSRFELTPALSDDPFISFALLADREGLLEVRLANNRGERFVAAHAIGFS